MTQWVDSESWFYHHHCCCCMIVTEPGRTLLGQQHSAFSLRTLTSINRKAAMHFPHLERKTLIYPVSRASWLFQQTRWVKYFKMPCITIQKKFLIWISRSFIKGASDNTISYFDQSFRGSLASYLFWPEIWGDLVKISRGEQRTKGEHVIVIF